MTIDNDQLADLKKGLASGDVDFVWNDTALKIIARLEAAEASLERLATCPFVYVGGGWFRRKAPVGEASDMLHGDHLVEWLREGTK
jgi:hypothetical protein